MWCDKCIDITFFGQHPANECPSDTTTLEVKDWDPKDGGGTSSPEYISMGCWKTNKKPVEFLSYIYVAVEDTDVVLTPVKKACGRIARRKQWWGFSLRECKRENGVMICECASVTACECASVTTL